MPKMAAIISRHSKITLSIRIAANSTTPPCNCRNKASFPLEEKWQKSSIVYKRCLISGNATNNYYVCCETELKPVFTIITKALNIKERLMLPNSKALAGQKCGKKTLPRMEHCSLHSPIPPYCSLHSPIPTGSKVV